MAHFEVNLIRHEILSPSRRRVLFWCMLAYLLLCALALGITAHHAGQQLLLMLGAREEMARLETEFVQNNPGQGGVLACRQRLEARLQARAVRLEAIARILDRRIGLARLMAQLLAPLPPEVTISDLDFDRGKGEISFSLLLPAGNSRSGSLSPSQIIQLWKEDPGLAARIRDLQAVSTQRRMVGNRPMLNLRYSCQLVAKER